MKFTKYFAKLIILSRIILFIFLGNIKTNICFKKISKFKY